MVPPCQRSNVIHRDITNPGSPLGRVAARGFHVSIEPQYVLSYERMIQASGPFQLHGKGPGENHIRAGTHGQMEMRLFGHFDSPRIDHDQPRAIALGGVDLPHEMQIAARRVVAPHDDELRKTDLLERCTGGCAESAGVGRATDAATSRAAAQQRSADLVKEAQRHGITRQHPVRAGIVERQQRLRAVAIDDLAYATVNGVESLIPSDSLELGGTLFPDAPQWVAHTVGAMDKLWIVIGHFRANGTVGDGIDLRAAHGDHLIAVNGHSEAARVRAIKGADAALFCVHVDTLRMWCRQINSTTVQLNSIDVSTWVGAFIAKRVAESLNLEVRGTQI